MGGALAGVVASIPVVERREAARRISSGRRVHGCIGNQGMDSLCFLVNQARVFLAGGAKKAGVVFVEVYSVHLLEHK
jgi:hypothetical protein